MILICRKIIETEASFKLLLAESTDLVIWRRILDDDTFRDVIRTTDTNHVVDVAIAAVFYDDIFWTVSYELCNLDNSIDESINA